MTVQFKKWWWKILCCGLLTYTFIAGFLGAVPQLPILEESIRNLYFHVCMWMVMIVCFVVSVWYAVRFLKKMTPADDIVSLSFAKVGFMFGLLGLSTGSIWAKYTWGSFWNNDPKQLGAAIALLIYGAYLVLRTSVEDDYQKSKLAAVYNIFAFAMLFPTIWILPRLVESLHPGGMGNPALNTQDIDVRMRLVFYPAIVGWVLLAVWVAKILIQYTTLQQSLKRQTP